MENQVFRKMDIKLSEPVTKSIFGAEVTESESRMVGKNIAHGVSLMMKKYEGGLLTKPLIDGDHKDLNLQLSCSRGEGLEFAHLKPGKIIMVAGGTGLYPFGDLIDLLFKSLLLSNSPEFAKNIE